MIRLGKCRTALLSCRFYSSKNSTPSRLISLKKPNINVKAIKSDPELYQDSVDRRRVKLPGDISIRELLEEIQKINCLQKQRNDLVHERNQAQKELSAGGDDGGDKTRTKGRLVDMKNNIQNLEELLSNMNEQVSDSLESVPNLISEDSLIEDQELVAMIHPDVQKPQSNELDHHTIATELGIVDFANASNVSGSSAYYLVGDGALLEQALVQYALSRARKAGWGMMTPPSLVRQEYTNACGFRPRDQNNEQQVYLIEDSALCLTGTAEIPLAGWAANRTLTSAQPIRKVGVSRSYRAEAGARGRDTKGLYRVHEFTKVEMFAWTATAEEATDVLEEILQLQMALVEDLGLCARVLNMPPDDLGAPAYKKYDIEAWMPGRGDWGEITSTSNCLDYQSRRLGTKYQRAGDASSLFANTLNGTAMAVPRMIVAILENNYDPATKQVSIPECLRPWMDDKSYIAKQ